MSGSTCRPSDQPAVTTCWRSACGSVPGMDRASTSAVPLELNSSSASTAPTPTAATGWSCPATVRTAPAAQETTPSCRRYPAGLPAVRSSGRIRAGSPAAARASGQTWPVPWSMRPVRDASDGSRTGSPPRAKTIHSGTLSQVEAGPACPLARSHSSLARLAWLDHGRPVVRFEGGGESRGLAGQLLELSPAAAIEPGDHGCGRPPGRVEQHAALGQAGHADAAHPDRSPGGFGRPDGAPDQVHGHVDEAVRVGLGPAAAAGVPRGRLLGIRGRRAATPTRPRPWTRWCRCRGRRRRRGAHGRSSPEPRSMILAGTWMRSTGRPGWPRRARSRAAATRPTS